MKIDIDNLLLTVLNESTENMDRLIEYLTDKPVDFSSETVRISLAKFVSNAEVYDRLFDASGELIDLDDITTSEDFAQSTFDTMPEEDRLGFKNAKGDDSIFEPSYKYLDYKGQLPEDTWIVRFLDERGFNTFVDGGGFIGTSDLSKLHVNRMFKRNSDGYAYGYVADSPEAKKQSKTFETGETYGGNCAFFKYPAVQIYHKLDHEPQVIIHAPDVSANGAILAKGTEDGKFIITNDMFDKEPKTYSELLKLIKKI